MFGVLCLMKERDVTLKIKLSVLFSLNNTKSLLLLFCFHL